MNSFKESILIPHSEFNRMMGKKKPSKKVVIKKKEKTTNEDIHELEDENIREEFLKFLQLKRRPSTCLLYTSDAADDL